MKIAEEVIEIKTQKSNNRDRGRESTESTEIRETKQDVFMLVLHHHSKFLQAHL
jgi:hypothetical protein